MRHALYFAVYYQGNLNAYVAYTVITVTVASWKSFKESAA